MRSKITPLFFLMLLLFYMSCSKKLSTSSNTDIHAVANTMAGLSTSEDLEVTLFASEPMMTNPTNMDIDTKGRVWICEGFNYRNALNPKNPYNSKGDRILILEDSNGDGKADKSKVFYQGEDINSALGIAVLGNKVYVSCSPNLFVFTDENGDDVPDKKEVLFSQIGGNQHDHAVHAIIFGHDGKLYFNFGNEGKSLSDKKGNPILDFYGNPIAANGNPYRDGMIFRCEEDGSNIEPMAWNFRNNYELALDSYGRMWQSDNDDDGNKAVRINYVLDYGNYGFKDEMTGAGWYERRTNLEKTIPEQHWHQNDPGVVPNLLYTGAGSPTGICLYEGNLLPERFRNQMIHSDAGPRVVRAYPVQKSGAGFSATIENILTSKDDWFRPSDVCIAPDGSLFVTDWYDPGVGGHAVGDLNRGRVYRIAPKNTSYRFTKPDFKTTGACIAALQSPNQAIRYVAWKKLAAMGKSAEKELLVLWNGTDSRMKARALWLLAKIDTKYIAEAAKSNDEDIRTCAVRVSRTMKMPNYDWLSTWAKDTSMQVKREVLFALKYDRTYTGALIWADLAKNYDGKDRWYLEALGIAAEGKWDSYLAALDSKIDKNWENTESYKKIIWRSRASFTNARLAEIIKMLPSGEQAAYFRAFDFQKNTNKTEALLSLLDEKGDDNFKTLIFTHLDPTTAKESVRFNAALDNILASVQSPQDYLTIVARYELKNQRSKLLDLTLNNMDSNKKVAEEAARLLTKFDGINAYNAAINKVETNKKTSVIALFGKTGNPEITDELTKVFRNNTLPMDWRKAAMNAMWEWNSTPVLWQMLKDDKIPSDLMAEAKNILTHTWHGDIRSEAVKFFEKDGETTQNVDMNKILNMKGNAAAGMKVMDTYCKICHAVKGDGLDFGPDLSTIGAKLSKEGLFKAIQNPSEGISFGYESQLITLKNGTTLQGIVASKTESEVLIKLPNTKELLRHKMTEIESIKQQKESLMPNYNLAEKDLINLISYLETLK